MTALSIFLIYSSHHFDEIEQCEGKTNHFCTNQNKYQKITPIISFFFLLTLLLTFDLKKKNQNGWIEFLCEPFTIKMRLDELDGMTLHDWRRVSICIIPLKQLSRSVGFCLVTSLSKSLGFFFFLFFNS